MRMTMLVMRATEAEAKDDANWYAVRGVFATPWWPERGCGALTGQSWDRLDAEGVDEAAVAYAQTRVRQAPVKPIAVGDIVRVKNFAVAMTVNDVRGSVSGDIECVWFDGATPHRGRFSRDVLERVL